jgi:transcription-repair coupling factor (superfamily II helicase)
MLGRNHMLLWAVASTIFASISISPNMAFASNSLSVQYIYKHPKLGFSLEYSGLLTAQDFPDGVVLKNNAMQIYDRINIHVTNTALERGYTNGACETFKSFRSAKAGEIVKVTEFGIGTYTKIANLKVNGYPAVRVVYEYRQQRNTLSLPDTGAPFPPLYAVSVYIQKGTDIWEVMSYGPDKETQEKSAITFEEVLRTLKFA